MTAELKTRAYVIGMHHAVSNSTRHFIMSVLSFNKRNAYITGKQNRCLMMTVNRESRLLCQSGYESKQSLMEAAHNLLPKEELVKQAKMMQVAEPKKKEPLFDIEIAKAKIKVLKQLIKLDKLGKLDPELLLQCKKMGVL